MAFRVSHLAKAETGTSTRPSLSFLLPPAGPSPCALSVAMPMPTLCLRPHLLARALVVLSAVAIVTALLLTHFVPGRFRIHPYPYLSDAGLRDPERIVMSFGLALSATLFVPVAAALHLTQEAYLDASRDDGSRAPALTLTLLRGKRFAKLRWLPIPRVLNCDILPSVGLRAGLLLAFFLAFFTAIPGWFFFHHIFALVFAVSAAIWCTTHALFSHAKLHFDDKERRLAPRVRVMYVLIGLQAMVVGFFGVIWGSVKAEFPFKMIPNKDPRFVMLAFLEYIGTSSFLIYIWMVSTELQRERLSLSLTSGKDTKFSSFSSCATDV